MLAQSRARYPAWRRLQARFLLLVARKDFNRRGCRVRREEVGLPTAKSQQPLLDPVRTLPDQRQKLLPRLLLVAEAPEHGRCNGGRVLLLDAAHHHAEMTSFDNYANTLWL